MIERLSVTVGGTEIGFETGRVAKQAHGAIWVSSGGTVVLSTACVSPDARPGQGFFPTNC